MYLAIHSKVSSCLLTELWSPLVNLWACVKWATKLAWPTNHWFASMKGGRSPHHLLYSLNPFKRYNARKTPTTFSALIATSSPGHTRALVFFNIIATIITTETYCKFDTGYVPSLKYATKKMTQAQVNFFQTAILQGKKTHNVCDGLKLANVDVIPENWWPSSSLNISRLEFGVKKVPVSYGIIHARTRLIQSVNQ